MFWAGVGIDFLILQGLGPQDHAKKRLRAMFGALNFKAQTPNPKH